MNKTNRLIYAISLSGLLMAMSIILQRFLVIPFGVSSLYRLSLGSVPIIMASLFLGPIFGGLVGAGSDFIGANLFPVGTFLPWPLISSTLYGVLPWVFVKLIALIKSKTKISFLYVFLGAIFMVLEVYVFTQPSIRHPFDRTLPAILFNTTFRVLFTLYMTILILGLIGSFIYLERRFKNTSFNKYTLSPSTLAFALLLMSVLVDLIYSSWWKYSLYQVSFLVSVFFHASIMLFLLPIQTFLITILGNAYAKSHFSKSLDNPQE